ncbi:MAG: LysR substrate-binding domain-containing protein [Lautropia sp.]
MARLDWYIRSNLKPRHLQLLVALDDLRHVGRVAAMLNVSQPAVSKALGELERGIGVQLFERGKQGLVPTPYGECMVRLCRSMLNDLDAVGEELRQLQRGEAGRLRIGVLPVAAPVIVPRAVLALRRAAPRAGVVLHEATADRLLPMLREDRLDLVVGTLPAASATVGLEVRMLHPGESVSVVAGVRHPLAARRRVGARDLARFTLIIPPQGTVYRFTVERALDALGLEPDMPVIESGSMTASNTLLRESDAVGFYSPHLAAHYIRLGWLKALAIDVPSVSAPIGCLWSKRAEQGSALGHFVELLQAVVTSELK